MANGPTLPPQAYTREILTSAFNWLQSQPESVKKLATTPDALVGLFMRAQRFGASSLEADAPVSSQNFMSDLKNLAEGLKQFEGPRDRKLFETASTGPVVPVQQPAQAAPTQTAQAPVHSAATSVHSNPAVAAAMSAAMQAAMNSGMQGGGSATSVGYAASANQTTAHQSVSQTPHQQTYTQANQSVHQAVHQSVHQATHQTVHQPAQHVTQTATAAPPMGHSIASYFQTGAVPVPVAAQAAVATGSMGHLTGALNERSLQMIQEVKYALNLTTDAEVINMMVSIAYKNLKDLLV